MKNDSLVRLPKNTSRRNLILSASSVFMFPSLIRSVSADTHGNAINLMIAQASDQYADAGT